MFASSEESLHMLFFSFYTRHLDTTWLLGLKYHMELGSKEDTVVIETRCCPSSMQLPSFVCVCVCVFFFHCDEFCKK